MSVAQYGTTNLGTATEVTVPETNDRPLQRLAMARHQQGISCRTVARRLNLGIEQVRQQERETADLPLSACTPGRRP